MFNQLWEKKEKGLKFAFGSAHFGEYGPVGSKIQNLKNSSYLTRVDKRSTLKTLVVKVEWNDYLFPVIDCDCANNFQRAKSYLETQGLQFIAFTTSFDWGENDIRYWIIVDCPGTKCSSIHFLVENCPGQDEEYAAASINSDACYIRFEFNTKFSKPFLKERSPKLSSNLEEFVNCYFNEWERLNFVLENRLLTRCLHAYRVGFYPIVRSSSSSSIEIGDFFEQEDRTLLIYQILNVNDYPFYCCLEVENGDGDKYNFSLIRVCDENNEKPMKVTKASIEEMLTSKYHLIRHLGKLRHESHSNLRSK